MSKNYVGIIIPKSTYERMPNLQGNALRMFSLWEKAAERHHLTVCYFRMFEIKPKETTIRAYVKEKDKYIKKDIPSPTVIYSRVLDHLPPFRSHVSALIEDGKIVFNIPNYDVEKYEVHKILSKDSFIRQYLPETEVFTSKSLNKMASVYNPIILKKNYGEFGIGAMKLEKIQDRWCLSYKTKGDNELKEIFFTKKLPPILQKRLLKHTYIIQEMIPLATYKGSPFDIRVALQKNGQGKFQVSGMMCKVAQNQDFLTNGSQGGTAYPLEEIAPFSHPSIPYIKLVEKINEFCLYSANVLDKHFTHIADLGFDIGITTEGKPYFIECNFISDYEGGLFKEGQLIKQEWELVFSTPMDYAKFLLDNN